MTDETLLTGGENTQVADGTVDGAKPATAGTDGQTAATAATDATATTNADATTEDGKSTSDDAPQGAPEKYEFAAPEGQTFDEGVISTFEAVARELNLPQDKAQLVLDKMAPVIAARQAERIEAVHEEWRALTKADKEFGGEKFAENLAVAKNALNQYASPELTSLLNRTGLGDHPEVIRLFVKVGRTIAEDTLGDGGGDPPPPKDDARSLYPNSNLN